jgi:putative membrane protein
VRARGIVHVISRSREHWGVGVTEIARVLRDQHRTSNQTENRNGPHGREYILKTRMKLLLRWVISSLSLFAAAAIVPGIRVNSGGWTVFAAMAVILGLVSAIIRPILKILSCPLILLTLGLFTLVINALTLMLASSVAVSWFHVGFYVDGFIPALLGSIIVSVVSVILTALVREETGGRY